MQFLGWRGPSSPLEKGRDGRREEAQAHPWIMHGGCRSGLSIRQGWDQGFVISASCSSRRTRAPSRAAQTAAGP